MASILNKKPKPDKSFAVDIDDFDQGLEDDNARLFNGDKYYKPSSTDFNEDNGLFSKEVESQFANIEIAAKETMSQLKNEKPFYDWKTKNQSFLRVYKELSKMGIKHNKFFLRLIDKGLQGINPYQAVLPLDLQLRIILECMINPWYWLREVCRIPQDGKPIEPGGGTSFILDRNNLACWYLMLNEIDFYQSKPRQRGKTQNALAILNYAYHFGTMSSTFLFFNKDQSLAKTNLYRFKSQRDLLPVWLQMRTVVDDSGHVDKGRESVTIMRNPITKNEIKVMPKALNPDSAMRLGRGETAAWHYYDECDFINHLHTIMDSAVFSFGTASRNARDNGGLAGKIFTSTPGDANSETGRIANEWISKMLKWNDNMFDEPISKLKKMISHPKRVAYVFVEHTWQELGLSMKWYEEQCKMVDYKEDVIEREINLKRLAGNTLSPFSRKDIMYIQKHVRKPIKTDDLTEMYTPFNIYEPLNKRYPYILSCDPAEGLSNDNYGITLINPYTLYPAAEFKTPFMNQTQLSALIVEFMDKYCPKSMIVVESNRGRETINRLLESKYRYQIWYDIDKMNTRITNKTDQYGALRQQSLYNQAYGLHTGTNRGRYFEILQTIMNEDKDKLCTEYLKEDVCGLIRKPTSGRVEAGPGFHDDNIMSYLMGLYVYENASNLATWGIVRGAREPSPISSKDTPETIKDKLLQMMSYIPENLMDSFKQALNRKDPVTDAENYRKELEREKRLYDLDTPSAITDPNTGYAPPEYQEAMWDRLDRQIEESNYIDTEVNLDDWF